MKGAVFKLCLECVNTFPDLEGAHSSANHTEFHLSPHFPGLQS